LRGRESKDIWAMARAKKYVTIWILNLMVWNMISKETARALGYRLGLKGFIQP